MFGKMQLRWRWYTNPAVEVYRRVSGPPLIKIASLQYRLRNVAFSTEDSKQFCLLADFYAVEMRSAMIKSRCKTCIDCETDELQSLACRKTR